MRDRLFVVGLLFGAPPLCQSQTEQPVPYVFETRVEMVSVPVAVVDKDDNFITGLGAESFSVYEDGVRQEIRLFAAGLEESWVGLSPELKDELSGRQVIGLVLDASGSMENEISLVREAAIKFLTNVPKTENLFILDFDENIRLSRYSSDDQRLVSSRVYDVVAEGWTALYDAVGTFLERVYELDGRKTLVVFSDGVDSRSTLAVGDVLDMVKLSDVKIHTIQFGARDRGNTTRTFTEGRFLRQLSGETGGSYALGSSLEQLDELYDRILEELFSQYTLGYVSTNTKEDGKYRKIKVEVDVERAALRYRKGYYGPPPPSN
ncbi:MAG TPA: VWA domain-containing protein [Vicinamibacteria bacterium]|nr:VWA domain-containing protein [Vicinamibacteria bacterium]